MSNDQKNCRPLRTEWVPAAYSEHGSAAQPSPGAVKPKISGFAKKVLKTGLVKRNSFNRR